MQPKTTSEYIRQFPAPVQKRLRAIRSMIKKLAPEADEKLSYGMPYFHLNGRLVYFAAFKKHIGLYPMASGIEKFKKELVKYKHAKGSVQFQHDEQLPFVLIEKIIKFRIKENRKSY